MLTRFPGLRQQLSNAKRASQTLKEVEKAGSDTINAFNKTAIAKILDDDDPVAAVGRILGSRNRSQQFAELADLAKAEGAVDGLKSAVLESVGQKASNFRQMREQLVDNGLLDLMKENTVLTADEASRLDFLTKRAASIEDNIAKASQTAGEDVLPPINQVFDLAVRVLGANLGAAGAAGSTGAPIVAAGAGSRVLRNLLEKIPATRTVDALAEIAQDPELMAKMLEKGALNRPERVQEITRSLNSALISAGIIRTQEAQPR